LEEPNARNVIINPLKRKPRVLSTDFRPSYLKCNKI